MSSTLTVKCLIPLALKYILLFHTVLSGAQIDWYTLMYRASTRHYDSGAEAAKFHDTHSNYLIWLARAKFQTPVLSVPETIAYFKSTR